MYIAPNIGGMLFQVQTLFVIAGLVVAVIFIEKKNDQKPSKI